MSLFDEWFWRYAIDCDRYRQQRDCGTRSHWTPQSTSRADDCERSVLPQLDVELAFCVSLERPIRSQRGFLLPAAGGNVPVVPPPTAVGPGVHSTDRADRGCRLYIPRRQLCHSRRSVEADQ